MQKERSAFITSSWESAIYRNHEFKIGDILVLPKRNLLVIDGSEHSLEPRVMDVLCHLAENSTDVVNRTDLIETIWEVEYGGDESLTRAISILRKTFKSAGLTETIIETIPKRGYRLTQAAVGISPESRPNLREEIPIASKSGLGMSEAKVLGNEHGRRRLTLVVIGAAAIVALGVFIGFQFLNPLSSNSESAVQPEAQVLSMIESGHLTVDEAKSLLETLSGQGAQQIVETMKDGSESQKKALRLIADRPTFEEGVAILESQAKTAADWKLIGELSQSRSPKRAVEALKKAIALAPEDYDTLAHLVKTQIISGNYDAARRTHKGLQAIAQTPLEYLKAAILEGDLAYETGRIENARLAIKSLTTALEKMEPLEALPFNPNAISPMDEARPKASEALATRGEARFQTKEYDKIESDLLRAVRLLEDDLNKFKGRDIMKARRKLAIYHDIRARAKHRLNQIDDHHEAHEKAIAQYRAMVDAGERRYLETLFIRLETLSREYWDLNATETAIEKVLESIERLEAYSTEFPTDQNLKLRRFRLKGTLALLKGDYDEAEREFFNGINFLRDEILKAGDAQKLSLLNDFTYRASGLLLRHKEVDPDSIYEIYKAALQAGDLFKINHGVSADLVKYEFSVRLNQGEKMISLGEPIDKVRGFMEQIIKDSQSETNFNLEGDIREKVKMMALYVIGSSHPDDLKAVAQQGLQIAESLDQRGQLSTDQQAYLGAFEEMLQRANKSDDLSNQ